MDFSLNENHIAIGDLARGILEKEMSPERVKQIQGGQEWMDRKLWATLADAGLLGIAVPEDFGGMGLGIVECCALLVELGRVVAPVPALAALVLGGLPVARFGTEEQKKALLPGLASGQTVLTAALVDRGSIDPGAPATSAHKQGSSWTITGFKTAVPYAHIAQRILVPASTDQGTVVFLVDPASDGLTITRGRSTSGEPLCDLQLDGVGVGEGDLLGGPGVAGDPHSCAAQWTYQHALVAISALQLGVSERALEMTTDYAREREQFGVPIGSFQAVQHRAADCYIDLQSMRWTTWRAAWKLSIGEPAPRETAVAKFWAAEGGSRIANAAQHLHAGLGVDTDYPIHRYFIWSKALELCLGSAANQIVNIGTDMAANPPQGNL
ncbi:MAG: acyl-CoA dehydrogenase family protein [Deltaproteobacteria bacterium]